jgi:hypothetical protein
LKEKSISVRNTIRQHEMAASTVGSLSISNTYSTVNTKKIIWGLAASLAMSGAFGTVSMAEPGPKGPVTHSAPTEPEARGPKAHKVIKKKHHKAPHHKKHHRRHHR